MKDLKVNTGNFNIKIIIKIGRKWFNIKEFIYKRIRKLNGLQLENL